MQRIFNKMLLLFCRRTMSANDLRANEGRETKALNCKPYTNLKEISELSNYCKPAVFVCTLLAVVFFSPVDFIFPSFVYDKHCHKNNCQINYKRLCPVSIATNIHN